jgi:adenosylcobinamide-phosphate guanylyltransferase
MRRSHTRRTVAVVMAGGRGTRIGSTEKPVLRVGRIPLVELVVEALETTGLVDVYVAVSFHTPQTRALCLNTGRRVIETPGGGYPKDVGELTQRFSRFVTVSADLPFVTPASLATFIESVRTERSGRVGLLPEGLCRSRSSAALAWPEPLPGIGRCRIVGINWVVRGWKGADVPFLFDDPELEFNVNTPDDLRRARRHWRLISRRAHRSTTHLPARRTTVQRALRRPSSSRRV